MPNVELIGLRGFIAQVRLGDGSGISLQVGTTDDFSGSKNIDAQSATTDPVLDDCRWCKRLGAHVVSHDRARFAQLDATQLYVADDELGMHEVIQSDASSDQVSPCD